MRETGADQTGNRLRLFEGRGTTSSGGSPNRTTTSPEICHPAERATSSLHQVLAGSRIARRKSPIALSEDRWSGGVLGNAQLKPSTVQLVPAAEIH
jgi:hypothetical protein